MEETLNFTSQTTSFVRQSHLHANLNVFYSSEEEDFTLNSSSNLSRNYWTAMGLKKVGDSLSFVNHVGSVAACDWLQKTLK